MKNILSPAITARYVRIHPVSWRNWISMRIELYGCFRGTGIDCKSNVIKLLLKSFRKFHLSKLSPYILYK